MSIFSRFVDTVKDVANDVVDSITSGGKKAADESKKEAQKSASDSGGTSTRQKSYVDMAKGKSDTSTSDSSSSSSSSSRSSSSSGGTSTRQKSYVDMAKGGSSKSSSSSSSSRSSGSSKSSSNKQELPKSFSHPDGKTKAIDEAFYSAQRQAKTKREKAREIYDKAKRNLPDDKKMAETRKEFVSRAGKWTGTDAKRLSKSYIETKAKREKALSTPDYYIGTTPGGTRKDAAGNLYSTRQKSYVDMATPTRDIMLPYAKELGLLPESAKGINSGTVRVREDILKQASYEKFIDKTIEKDWMGGPKGNLLTLSFIRKPLSTGFEYTVSGITGLINGNIKKEISTTGYNLKRDLVTDVFPKKYFLTGNKKAGYTGIAKAWGESLLDYGFLGASGGVFGSIGKKTAGVVYGGVVTSQTLETAKNPTLRNIVSTGLLFAPIAYRGYKASKVPDYTYSVQSNRYVAKPVGSGNQYTGKGQTSVLLEGGKNKYLYESGYDFSTIIKNQKGYTIYKAIVGRLNKYGTATDIAGKIGGGGTTTKIYPHLYRFDTVSAGNLFGTKTGTISSGITSVISKITKPYYSLVSSRSAQSGFQATPEGITGQRGISVNYGLIFNKNSWFDYSSTGGKSTITKTKPVTTGAEGISQSIAKNIKESVQTGETTSALTSGSVFIPSISDSNKPSKQTTGKYETKQKYSLSGFETSIKQKPKVEQKIKPKPVEKLKPIRYITSSSKTKTDTKSVIEEKIDQSLNQKPKIDTSLKQQQSQKHSQSQQQSQKYSQSQQQSQKHSQSQQQSQKHSQSLKTKTPSFDFNYGLSTTTSSSLKPSVSFGKSKFGSGLTGDFGSKSRGFNVFFIRKGKGIEETKYNIFRSKKEAMSFGAIASLKTRSITGFKIKPVKVKGSETLRKNLPAFSGLKKSFEKRGDFYVEKKNKRKNKKKTLFGSKKIKVGELLGKK